MGVKVNNEEDKQVSSFTEDQLKAYNELIEFINAPYNENDYKRALVGFPGTGKTYLVNSIIRNCNQAYSTIGLAAPTHKAGRILRENISISNIKVNTLASDLGLKINYESTKFDINNPPFDPKGRIKIGDYKLYIVDEASMIPAGLCKLLEKIAKSNQCKIIYIGDENQLPPPGEKYSSAFYGTKTYKLSKIVRQDEDNPIVYLLSLIRYDIVHRTHKFIEEISKNSFRFDENNTKGYAVCNDIKFNELITRNFSDEELTRNTNYCKILAYTNDCISNYNKLVRSVIIKDAEKSALTSNDLIASYITIVNQFNDVVLVNSEEYIVKEIVNYTHTKYKLKGFMVKFQAIYGGKISTPLFVVDHLDNFSVLRYYQLCNEMINAAKNAANNVKATLWKEYFKFKEGCLLLTDIKTSTKTISFSRNLDYGFAYTIHKSQGSTFDTVFVNLDDILYDSFGRARTDITLINKLIYVACSRAKNKLYIKFTR